MSADIIEHPSGRSRPDAASKRWWRPHDIPAWAVLTAAMETEAIGALGLLLDYCYMHGKLPNSDPQRARICKLSGKRYSRHREALMVHFTADGRNVEIDLTREHSKRISAVKSEAGRKGGTSKSQAYARQEPGQNTSYLHQHLQSQSQIDREQPSTSSSSTPPAPSPPPLSQSRAREAEALKAEALASLPTSAKAHPGWSGLSTWIGRLLGEGVEPVDIVVGIAQCVRSLKGEPPSTFGYFTAAIERARETRTAPVPVAATLRQTGKHELGEAGEALRKRLGELEFAAWFSRSRLISILGDTVTLMVGSEFIRSRIISQYERHCIAAFSDMHPDISQLALIVEADR